MRLNRIFNLPNTASRKGTRIMHPIPERASGTPQRACGASHKPLGAQPYVDGALLAIRKVNTFSGLRRGLDHVLDL